MLCRVCRRDLLFFTIGKSFVFCLLMWREFSREARKSCQQRHRVQYVSNVQKEVRKIKLSNCVFRHGLGFVKIKIVSSRDSQSTNAQRCSMWEFHLWNVILNWKPHTAYKQALFSLFFSFLDGSMRVRGGAPSLPRYWRRCVTWKFQVNLTNPPGGHKP